MKQNFSTIYNEGKKGILVTNLGIAEEPTKPKLQSMKYRKDEDTALAVFFSLHCFS